MQCIVPNPGSKEAIAQGCTCPVMDNHNGRGVPGYGEAPCFWVNSDCPLHGSKTRKLDAE